MRHIFKVFHQDKDSNKSTDLVLADDIGQVCRYYDSRMHYEVRIIKIIDLGQVNQTENPNVSCVYNIKD